MHAPSFRLGLALALLTTGCSSKTTDGGAPTASATTGATTAAAKGATTAAATGALAQARPAGDAPKGYDRSAIQPISDDCKDAGVVVATAPKSVGADYGWPFTRQALFANRQFKVYTEEGGMGGSMTVRFRRYADPKSGAYTLVAECEDGKTCNELAAMLKAVVRSSSPKPFCGKPPVEGKREYAPVHPLKDSWAPEASDTIGKCARLGACMIATDRATPGDPALECQKAPAKSKLECAAKESCAEVLACLGK